MWAYLPKRLQKWFKIQGLSPTETRCSYQGAFALTKFPGIQHFETRGYRQIVLLTSAAKYYWALLDTAMYQQLVVPAFCSTISWNNVATGKSNLGYIAPLKITNPSSHLPQSLVSSIDFCTAAYA